MVLGSGWYFWLSGYCNLSDEKKLFGECYGLLN